MYCINCGSALNENNKFCPNCGTAADKEQIGYTKIRCPHCRSTNLQTTTKGISTAKAATGAVLVGSIGLLAGFADSNKVKVICLQCGKTFKTSAAFVDDSGLSEDEIMQINKDCETTPLNPIYWVVFLIVAIIGSLLLWGLLS